MRDDLVWDTEVGGADPATIEAFERKVGRKFPDSYLEIVKKYDGATVNADCYKFISNSSGNEEVYSVGIFHAFGEIDEISETMQWNYENRPEWFPEDLVSFSRDGGSNRLCFDYRKDQNSTDPQVVVWQFHAESGKDVSFVAENFSAFLSIIFEDPDDIDEDDWED